MTQFAKNKALQTVIERATQDRPFRSKLLNEPHAAIQAATGTPVPASLRIKFIEKGADLDLLIVLPDLIAQDGELTEDDVEAVAGGTDWGCGDVSTA